MLQAFGRTDRGHYRPNNEDCFAVDEQLGLCVLADGMGGHKAGEIAARMAVDAVLESVGTRRSPDDTWPFGFDPSQSEAGNVLRTAVETANLRVLDAAQASERCQGMGTTVVAALVRGSTLTAVHVGDSRLYLLTAGVLRQLTADDSWMASMLLQDPAADPDLLQQHPLRHALTNVVGNRAGAQVHLLERPIGAGDVLALTTDGVHGVLDDRALQEILAGDDNVSEMAAALVTTALTRGSRDNCTAIVAKFVQDGGSGSAAGGYST